MSFLWETGGSFRYDVELFPGDMDMLEMTASDETVTPKVSIVLATFNAAETIARCLESIRVQSEPSWELLVKDGGSTDGTLPLLETFAQHIQWLESSPDTGIYQAWNIAIEKARGEYVWFLGADDRLRDADTLAKVVVATDERRYDLITTRGAIVDTGDTVTATHGGPWNYRKLGRRMNICHPGLIHHRSLFERYGKFNERYRIAADLEFLLRLPEDLVTRHLDVLSVLVGGAGVSRKKTLMRLREQREVLASCERYGSIRAYLVWLDKLWRYPVARLLGIPH